MAAEFLGQPLERLLAIGELVLYTYRIDVAEAPPHVCRSYLVRIEGGKA
jgi:hypothetical protein